MATLTKLHSKFVNDMIEASKLLPSSFSIIPSVLFLAAIFALFYSQFHRYTNSFTRWRTKLYKDIVFHWTYFYTSRVWFLFLKLSKWIIRYTDGLIELNSTTDDAYFNKTLTHFCVFMIVLAVSLIPWLILCIRHLNRREIPNFLMWVAEDPWIRSEIGTSGHYLERPPRIEIYCPSKNNASYRSRRSSSVDTNVYLSKEPNFFRPCKSMMSVNVVKSVTDLTD